MNVGEIWQFSRHAPFHGKVRIHDINGWGEIVGEYHDSIGTPVRSKIEAGWLDGLADDQNDFDFPEDW